MIVEREADIEKALVKAAEVRNIIALKLSKLGEKGWPDRILLLDGKAGFVEVKSSIGRLHVLQEKRIEWLQDHDFFVRVLRSREDVEHVLDSFERWAT